MSAEPETQTNRLESLALTLLFSAISAGLLALIAVATKSGPKTAGWWTQPWLMPGVALGILVAANLLTLHREVTDLRRRPPSPQEAAEGWAALLGWLRPLEFLAYYVVYVWAIQHAGYFVSTLVFALFLLWRVGLGGPKWLLAGLGLSLLMVGVFRIGLGVWMPAPEVYEFFPDAVRNRMIRWF